MFLPNHCPCPFLPITWSFREGIHNHCRSCVVSSCALGKWNPLFQENFFQNFCSWGNCLAQLSGALHDSFYKNFCSGKLFDPALWRESCPIGDCPWACGARLHMCKVFDNSYFLLRLQKNWTFENKFSIFSALTPIALTSKLTPGQRPRRNLPELPTTWRPRLAAPPWWTWSTRSRGGRWGRRPGTKSALCVCWGQRQGITSSLLEITQFYTAREESTTWAASLARTDLPQHHPRAPSSPPTCPKQDPQLRLCQSLSEGRDRRTLGRCSSDHCAWTQLELAANKVKVFQY